MAERLIIGTEHLPDDLLEALAVDALRWQGSTAPAVRYLGHELAAAVGTVLTSRRLRRYEEAAELRRAHGFPDWQTCVDTLPPEVAGEV